MSVCRRGITGWTVAAVRVVACVAELSLIFARRVTILNGIVNCICLFDQSWIHSSIHFRARPITK